MAGRAKYTQEQRDAALAALMASAVEQPGGGWAPMFRDVMRSMSIPKSTLQRWWKGRDVGQDGPLRASCTRARSEVRQEGAEDWIRSQVDRVKAVVWYITDPIHYKTELEVVPFSDGQLLQVQGTRPDHAARAMKLTVEVLKDMDGLLSDDNGAATPERRMSRLRQAATQVGLSKKGKT